jgi:predicted ester cyclase
MSPEEMKAIARRVPEEVFNKGDLIVLDEIIAPDFVNHTPLPGLPDRGVEAVKAVVNAMKTAFLDFHYTIDDEIVEGDKLVQLVTAHGTNNGSFMGMPPTGNPATWKEVHILRVVNGKIVEHTGIVDEMGLMRQLGLVPSTAQARP